MTIYSQCAKLIMKQSKEGKKMSIEKLNCKRCLYSWYPKSETLPKVCPNCCSPYYNRDRVKDIPVEKQAKVKIRIRKKYSDAKNS